MKVKKEKFKEWNLKWGIGYIRYMTGIDNEQTLEKALKAKHIKRCLSDEGCEMIRMRVIEKKTFTEIGEILKKPKQYANRKYYRYLGIFTRVMESGWIMPEEITIVKKYLDIMEGKK